MKIASLLRKKWLLAAVAAAVVGSAAYAFAATLGINSTSLGAGNASVESCIPSGSPATATYTTGYNQLVTGHYQVSTVVVTLDPADTCKAGDTVQIALEGSSSTPLATATHVLTSGDLAGYESGVDGTGSTFTYTYVDSGTPGDGQFGTTAVAASDVTGIAVSAVGATSS
jgi:hypothetical protein